MVEAIYFDVDGVLLDFSSPFANYWNQGLEEKRWNGNLVSDNPNTWSFGYRPGIDDMTELNKAIGSFHEAHEHLPVIHGDIPAILKELQNRYHIILVSAYPDEEKRIANLEHHGISYDIIACNIHNKLEYIQEKEKEGFSVIAIFEDGPHHIEKLLLHYGGKIWSPAYWNYLSGMKDDKRIRFYETPHEWKDLY
ncbi:Hypothetical protein HVR_LOCUS771 [uncultured virus]|nr:Hypothetical protein HVR_LOCUS771 [uncultured virus]